MLAKPVTLDFGVEDPAGQTSRVAVLHYPFSLNAAVAETDIMFPIGAVIAIREPYYKFAPVAEIPIIRVDSPSDIVFLNNDSPLLQSLSWSTEMPSDAPSAPTTAIEWKTRGNDLFKRKQWLCAALAFSEGLKLQPTNHLLLLNRAAAYLELHWFASASCDAETVLAMNVESPVHKQKAVYRASKSYYLSGRYDEVRRLAVAYPKDVEAKEFFLKAPIQQRSMAKGRYDIVELLKQTRSPGSRPDVAPYTGPVEVKPRPSNPRRLGLFVTRDVNAGDLLVSYHLFI